MNDQEREKVERIRSALKKGRAQRVETRADLAEELYQAAAPLEFFDDPIDHAEFDRVMQKGKSLNMIETVKKKFADGSVHTVDLACVKWREPYEKRPSVRAQKKHKSKSKGLSP